MVGNPANTNALICSRFAAPTIPVTAFTAMTRLDENRARAQVAAKHGVPVSGVRGVYIWGNHSSTQFPDVANATSGGKALPFDGSHDAAFIELIQKRGAAVIAARKLSSAMSAAKAAADHMRDWWLGTDVPVSMGVISDGSQYGAPADVMFSFPCTVGPDRQWNIVQGLSHNDAAKERIKKTADELVEERGEALLATGAQL